MWISVFPQNDVSKLDMNHIHFLEGDDGFRIHSQIDIQGYCVNYFAELLGGEVSPTLFFQDDITNLLGYDCSSAQRASLEGEFTALEIKNAFFSLPKNKTCRPDGFSA